jgi:hypothetical protein
VRAPQPVVAAVRGGGSEAPLRRRRRPDATKVANCLKRMAPTVLLKHGASRRRVSELTQRPHHPRKARSHLLTSGARLVRWKRMAREPCARRCLTFELRGRNRRGAWPAKRSIDHESFAGQAPCRWRSRSSDGLGSAAEPKRARAAGNADLACCRSRQWLRSAPAPKAQARRRQSGTGA